MSLFSELKRRNVFRVATAYVIVGWLLTEILATLFPMFGVPDWVVKAVVIVVAMGFVPLLVFSWAFELTPEGLKREKDVDRDSSITSATGKKLDYVTIVAVVLGVAFIGWSKTGTDEPAPAYEIVETSGAPSVAVLPFVNMSGNTENDPHACAQCTHAGTSRPRRVAPPANTACETRSPVRARNSCRPRCS